MVEKFYGCGRPSRVRRATWCIIGDRYEMLFPAVTDMNTYAYEAPARSHPPGTISMTDTSDLVVGLKELQDG